MILGAATALLFQFTPIAAAEFAGTDPAIAPAIEALCPLPAGETRPKLLAREDAAAGEVRRARGRVTARQWRSVACARARLHLMGALSRESIEMAAGTSWRDGAIDAAHRAARLEPTGRAQIELLAWLISGYANAPELPALGRILSKAADGGVTAPVVLRLCTDLALRSAAPEAGRRCAATGLAGGHDSTWHQLRLAWLSERDADSLKGVRQFVAGAAAAHDSVARSEVGWHLAWFLSPQELESWWTLADSARGPWVAERLLERDIRDGQPPGSRLAEHFGRLDYVMRAFPLHIPAMMRGISRTGAATFLGVDTTSADGGRLTIFREYGRWQLEFDDRGVVWMRFGAPTKMGRSTPASGQRALETWRYDVDDDYFLVHFTEADFDGSSGTAVLATGIIGPWQCGLDVARCLAATMAQGGAPASLSPSESELKAGLNPERIGSFRDQDREYLQVATTKDNNSPRGMKPIGVVGRLYQLWHPLNGAPLAVVAYGARLRDLVVPSGAATVSLSTLLNRWDGTQSAWSTDTLPGEFTVPSDARPDTYLSAFKLFPDGAGQGPWGLVVRQDSTRWGRAWGRAEELGSGRVALSDLIVAPDSRGLSWVLDGERVFLSPGGTVRRAEPVHLFYQVSNGAGSEPITTTVSVRRLIRDRPDSTLALQIGFAGTFREGITGQQRLLDVSRLEKGRYQLEVRLTDPRGTLLAGREVVVDIE